MKNQMTPQQTARLRAFHSIVKSTEEKWVDMELATALMSMIANEEITIESLKEGVAEEVQELAQRIKKDPTIMY